MSKITNRVEDIFSHAVALEQSGRLRNTVFCRGDRVYILNEDHTVLLRFPLRAHETPFKHPVSFKANDYDSRDFQEEGGKIVFVKEEAGFIRRKSCGTPGDTPDQIHALAESLLAPAEAEGSLVTLTSSFNALLDESLSHIEFRAEAGELIVVQRNIYSGAVTEMRRAGAAGEGGGLGLSGVSDDIRADFGPLGLRTPDFLALFSFNDTLRFIFPAGSADTCWVEGSDPKMPFQGVVSLCRYDEMGEVTSTTEGDGHGREKSQVRVGQPGAHRQVEGGLRRTAVRR